MRQRLKANDTIDKVAYEQFKKEIDYWKHILFRIIAFMKFLAKHNLAFRGSNEKLYQESNGVFLGLAEMAEEFDPIIKEHVRRIISHQEHVHYLVTFSANSVKVEETFLGFLNIDDNIGKGLFEIARDELESLSLDIDDMRGQGYDNGSNMKGKHKGVQARFIEVNRIAFYTLCGFHSLNLALCDMANTCSKARDFFRIIQRVYTILANSTKRWQILKDNVKDLTPTSLSTTRWESRVDSVRVIRFQLSNIRESLLDVEDKDIDPKIQSEAKSLARTENCDFEFLVLIVIWYQILNTINIGSKKLQFKDMLINVAIIEVNKLLRFFKSYREVGLSKAIEVAKGIAIEMGVNPVSPQRRLIHRKRQFDEVSNENEVVFSPEENFKVNYFLVIIDQVIASLEAKFIQYDVYEKIFGFMFPKTLRGLHDEDQKSCCENLQDALKHGESSDIDANELHMELRLMDTFLPSDIITPIDAFEYSNQADYFPNALVAYRELLTILVTVASTERNFSKLKLLKSYLRSTMSQNRLNGLALISTENEILEGMDYEELIQKFA